MNEALIYNPANDAGADTLCKLPFVCLTRSNWISKTVSIAFTDVATKPGYLGAPTNGVKYYFPSDPTIESHRIKAVSIYIKIITGAVQVQNDVEVFPVGSYFYNIAAYSQVADFFLCLKTKTGDVIWRNMPLTRLTYLNGNQATGLLMATDLPANLSLSNSYIVKRGAAALPTLPWVIPFQFHYEPK